MPRRCDGSGGGRLHVTDDSANIVGTGVEVRPKHLRALNVTKTKQNADETRRGHRRRIKRIIKWWMLEYSHYFEVGTRILSLNKKEDPMMFFHTCDREHHLRGLPSRHGIGLHSWNKTKGGRRCR